MQPSGPASTERLPIRDFINYFIVPVGFVRAYSHRIQQQPRVE